MRTVLRWLDPWAASLLGVLVALGVVILLATPGPWHVVGESRRVQLMPKRPADIALFALDGHGSRCTAVLWLHADYEMPSLTASVVAPATQGLVAGGGYARVDRLVTDAGPAVASRALGQALGVPMAAWATLAPEALREALPGMFPLGDQHAQRREYRRASEAWAGRRGIAVSWRRQYLTLAAALPESPFDGLSIVAFSNYVLGFGYVKSDLDLQGAASLGQLLQSLTPAQVRVRAVPAVVERCRGAQTWRVDSALLAPLTGSLAFGVVPPPRPPTLHSRRVAPAVLVAGPPAGGAGRAYLRELRAGLRASSEARVQVAAMRPRQGQSLAAAVGEALDARRPLAVVLASAIAPAELPAEQTAAELEASAAVLRQRNESGVVCAPALAAAADQAVLTQAMVRTRLPVAPVPLQPGATGAPVVWDAATARLVARANAATLVRACWPGALAPRLPSTVLGFSFAAARTVKVGIVGDAVPAGRMAARLGLYGWTGLLQPGSRWTPPLAVRAVYYHSGLRRQGLALAGDLRLSPAAAVLRPDAPAPVTLGLPALK